MPFLEKLKHAIKHPVDSADVVCDYCTNGVLEEQRDIWWVNFLKIANQAVRSFLNKDIQDKACNLTYRTVLAVVPVLAMLFAVGQGLGFKKIIVGELVRYFPAQHQALEQASQFVDNYLSQASQGLFVGIGVVFMLWTLVSLMSNVEKSFNEVWEVSHGRPWYRQIVDYTAMFILLPVLLICSAGLQIFLSSVTQNFMNSLSLSHFVVNILDYTPLVLSCLAFTVAFKLIPNTKVVFKYAMVSGLIFGSLFYGVEWLFVTGQIYVTKYNAIYGSFAFIMLLLIWVQLSWLIVLTGVTLTHAIQNKNKLMGRKQQLKTMADEYFEAMTKANAEIIEQLHSKYRIEEQETVSDTSKQGNNLSTQSDREATR